MESIKKLFALPRWTWAALTFFILGYGAGGGVERSKVYGDCRYAGVTRIGEAAFKCEQFSKVVLLTPDEQAKKEVKK
jgi:hypothetical protein